MATVQPKINRRKEIRYVIGLFLIAGLFLTWYFLKDYLQDVDPGSVDTTGWISALKETPNGSQVVALKADGTLMESPLPDETIQDRDPVWVPDGERIFMSSNRDEKKNAFHIYRWNVARNSISQRTTGSRAQEKPYFGEEQVDPKRPTALVISGGVVVELNPRDGSTHQLLPPIKGVTQNSSEGGGSDTQFGPEYEHLGGSFREARWCKDRKYIVSIMRRDEGETLVLQNMQPASEQEALPIGVVAGDHIQFDVDEKTGNIVYAVQNFDFLDRDKILADAYKSSTPSPFIKDGKLIKPYRHLLGILDPDKPENSGPIIASTKDEICFSSPAISPDGSVVAIDFGKYDSGMLSTAIVVLPFKKFTPSSPNQPAKLIDGLVGPPAWSPDGQRLVFTMKGPEGTRDIYTMRNDGGSVTDLTSGKGFNFSEPHFSPAQSGSAQSGSGQSGTAESGSKP